MKEFLRKNFVIILAFTLPVLLIVVVALSTYLPSLFLSTDYNFVYTSCTDGRNYYPYRCDGYLQKRYIVVGNKLVVNPVDMTLDSNKDGVPDFSEKYTDRIFLHDTKKNESREITLEEAQTMTLNSLLTSPDGVTVSSYYDRNGGDFFFIFDGGSSSYGYYLTKGKSRNKINLINSTDQYYYQNNFQFIGWVLPGRN
ncbi:MAG: hypothetical protein A3C06_02200 [Candidatus Taylorbacteria bacterium RIFCSPHIGHO2_02_FULL_46_13]|uniref:Uncharacterized protein n=1 Tax=Candidatus Taylorbacteria bacterium RIFCSPHIGHO2_02_FULL_46_13 TaxID=1802312 RepID=A0A1G2MSS4_9BACT|nr:MAG: hypothetical protein A3C06_02200 [Candidatus Taylorbacteria bacterium RIFCSPHIGHO2_02_FULL_46_13]